MSNVNNGSKYVFKVVVLIIVVIINIIAIIGVVSTVSKAVKELRVNISTGKISKESSENKINTSKEDKISLSDSANMEDVSEMDSEMNLDFGSLFKTAIKDKDGLKSIILMAIALILLAGAVFILIKLK